MAPLPVPVSFKLPATIGGQQLLGLALIGLDIYQNRIAKIARFVEHRMRARDEDAAEEIVRRARADVAYDRGDLFNGIRWWRDGDACVVQASGVRTTMGGIVQEDHAGFVEHGTRAGVRDRKVSYVADENYHDLTAGIGEGSLGDGGRRYGRSRLQYRGHPGTPAQPFFYDNARDVLNERGAYAESVIGLALDEDA